MTSAEEVTKSADSLTIDRIPMDERRRWLIKIVMLIRYTFRGYFGLKFANKWGFYVDRHMSRKIHEFQDWLDYPNGDHVLEGHQNEVFAAVISNDGQWLFTGDSGGNVITWSMLNNSTIHDWKAHDRRVQSLAFKCGLLVSSSADASIKIWDTLRDYQLVHTLEGHSDIVMSVDINEKATQVISGSGDDSIRVWSVKTGECIGVLMGHSRCVSSVMFIDDLILSGSYDLSIKTWNPYDGTEIQTVDDGIYDRIYHLSINCDHSIVASVSNSGITFHTWPDLNYVLSVSSNSHHCAFHPIHPHILAVPDRVNYSIRIFDVNKSNFIRTWKGHSSAIRSLCFTPDGSRLVSASSDRTVRISDISNW